MPGMKKKKSIKDIYPKTWGAGSNPTKSMKPKAKKAPAKKMNPLDKAITEKRPLPIKGRKRIPSDSDVVIPGMKPSKSKFRRNQGR